MAWGVLYLSLPPWFPPRRVRSPHQTHLLYMERFAGRPPLRVPWRGDGYGGRP
nr:MAG TPA: hypothetical protein [Caudoviricetes sp.]